MANEVFSAREGKTRPINAVGAASRTKERAEEIISNFRSKYTTIFATVNDGIPLAKSNFAYSLTEKKRREKFPFLENVGTEDKERAIDYVVGKAVKGGAKEVAKALNASDLGDRWRAVRDEKALMELRSTDVWGNEHRLFIKPRKKRK